MHSPRFDSRISIQFSNVYIHGWHWLRHICSGSCRSNLFINQSPLRPKSTMVLSPRYLVALTARFSSKRDLDSVATSAVLALSHERAHNVLRGVQVAVHRKVSSQEQKRAKTCSLKLYILLRWTNLVRIEDQLRYIAFVLTYASNLFWGHAL
jgi:hypothetical protein